MPDIGPMEIILVLVIALLVLGPSKLPEIGKSLGSSIREFREGVGGVRDSVRLDAQPPQQPQPNTLTGLSATPRPAQPVTAATAPQQPAPAAAPSASETAGTTEPRVGA